MSDMGTELVITAIEGGLELVGEIDARTAPALNDRLTQHLASAPGVRLDVRGVTFMDSSGLRVLLGATEASRANGGDLVLLSPTPIVIRLLDISGLGGHFSVLRDDETTTTS
jgi:anti-anti-sigma factor